MGSSKHNFGNINKKNDGNEKEVFNQDNQQINTTHSSIDTTTTTTSTNKVYNEKGHINRKNNKNKHHNKELYQLLPTLPVVVCVAMYRTNGVLESNVMSIGRTEGDDLWFFS